MEQLSYLFVKFVESFNKLLKKEKSLDLWCVVMGDVVKCVRAEFVDTHSKKKMKVFKTASHGGILVTRHTKYPAITTLSVDVTSLAV